MYDGRTPVYDPRNPTVCRYNIWSKTTTALGVMQITIGIGFLTFTYLIYAMAFQFPLRFVGIGAMSGCVIVCAGGIGVYSAKRRTKSIVAFLLLLSMLSLFCSMLSLVIGILGASYGGNTEDTSLLVPIFLLVFSAVEIIVSAWAVGLCVQAFCCPNISLGHIAIQQPAGYGLSHMLVAEDACQSLQASDIPIAGNAGQFLIQRSPAGFQYVPIITTGGVLHGIQAGRQQQSEFNPNLNPSHLGVHQVKDSKQSTSEKDDVENELSDKFNQEEEREDVCLLP